MENKKEHDIANFSASIKKMVATNKGAYIDVFNRRTVSKVKDYTLEEVEEIINSGDLISQVALSQNYYNKDGFYSRLMLYYATLLCYYGMLIPDVKPNSNLSDKVLRDQYYKASKHISRMKLRSLCVNFTLKACVNGCYYGALVENSESAFSVIDLPPEYCRSRYKDIFGNELVEFNLRYFDSIIDKKAKVLALNTYPSFFKKEYRKYKKGRSSNWVIVPPEIGFCFSLSEDGRPRFLNVIPSTIQYEEDVELKLKRDKEEIHKIVVQKIPHLSDGTLVFEPDEAEEMHKGSVNMLSHNDNISVLTTYADVDSIASKTSSEANRDDLKQMADNFYAQAGTSSQIFSSNGNLTLEQSINNDMALMMILAEKYSNFVANMVNKLYSNKDLSFTYKILPITWYNKEKEVEKGLSMANSGYSFLYPSVAMGFEQNELGNIKTLENTILNLQDKLIPLQTSYTQSNKGGKPGAPEKDLSEKSPKTIANVVSLDEGGQS